MDLCISHDYYVREQHQFLGFGIKILADEMGLAVISQCFQCYQIFFVYSARKSLQQTSAPMSALVV